MAVTTFKVLTWNANDLITDSKMDVIASNLQFFNDNMPRMKYTGYEYTRTYGTRIAAGVALMAPKPTSAGTAKRVDFNGFFSTVCRPIITTGVNTFHFRYASATINGQGQMFPDHRGFVASLWNGNPSGKRNFTNTCYFNWIAMGY